MHRVEIQRALIAALFALMMLTPSRAIAQFEAKAEASFAQHTCYLGDQVSFQIVVKDIEQATPPDLTSLPGATFAFAGASNSSSTVVSIVNGRRKQTVTNQYVMRWVVTPDEPGTLVVPPVHVGLGGGRIAETNEARLRVIEPEPADKPVLRFQLDEDTLYVNQTTRLHVTWLLVSDVEDYSFRGSRPSGVCSIQPAGQPGRGRDNAYAVDIFGVTTQGRLGYGMLDGERIRTFEFDLLVTPTRAGELKLGPITVSFDERVSRRSTRRVFAQTDPILINVLDLPTEGRPDNFDGLLGPHAIDADAAPTDVNVGDPIELTITISGPEPMPGVRDGPDLTGVPGFSDDFRLASDGWTFQPTRRAGQRVFSTTVRAAHDGVTEIPRIELPFFDPGEGEYRVARSKPIPIHVRPVHEVTAADAVVSSGPASVSREPLTTTAAGVWAIERGPAVLADTRGLSDDALRHPGVLVALIAPSGVFALAAVVAIRRTNREDESSRRRRQALATARRTLRREGPAQAVRVYLAEAFGTTPRAITGADGRRLLAEVGGADADAVAELISVHEAEHYAAGRYLPDTPADAARVLDLLRRVDRSIGRGA